MGSNTVAVYLQLGKQVSARKTYSGKDSCKNTPRRGGSRTCSRRGRQRHRRGRQHNKFFVLCALWTTVTSLNKRNILITDELADKATSTSQPSTPTSFPDCQKRSNHKNGRNGVLHQECVEKLYALASGCPSFNSVHSLTLFKDKPKLYGIVTLPNYMKSTIASKSRLYHDKAMR